MRLYEDSEGSCRPLTEAERALTDHGNFRAKMLPTPWIDPEFVEIGGSSDLAGGLVSLSTLATQVRASGAVTWILHGDAGSGKSIALRGLEVRLLHNQVPTIYLNAAIVRTLDDEKLKDVRTFVRQSRPRLVPERYWKSQSKQGKVVILVDAINEVFREFSSGRRCHLVQNLLTGSHDFTVVATTRQPDQDAGELRPIRRLTTRELTALQVEAFLKELNLAPTACLTRLQAIGLGELSRSPLILSALSEFLTSTAAMEGLPLSRAGLLRHAVLRNLDNARISPAVRADIEEGLDVKAAWAAAAVCSFFNNSSTFTRQEAATLLDRCDSEGRLRDLLDLFLETGPVERTPSANALEPSSFSLSHSRFVELGMAQGWGEGDPPDITLNNNYFGGFSADWCALQSDPKAAIWRLVNKDAVQNHRFEILTDILIANKALLDDDLENRIWEILAKAFTLPMRDQVRLANALNSLPPSRVLDGLAHGLLSGLVSDYPAIVNEVEEALLSGRLDGRTFQRIFRRGSRRFSALPHQEKVGSPLPEDSIQNSSAGADLNASSLHSLTDYFDPDELADGSLAHVASADLANALFDSGKKTRVAAAKELGRRLPQQPVLSLVNRLPETVGERRLLLLDALGRIGSPTYVSLLRTELSSSDALVRVAAVTALARIGTAPALDLLRGAIPDPDPRVRMAIVRRLGRVGDPRDVPYVFEVLEDEDSAVTYTAVGAVLRFLNYRWFGDPAPLHPASVVEIARANLNECKALPLARICKVLGAGTVPEGSKMLADLTMNKADSVRGAALTALEKLDQVHALECALQMIKDPDPANRGAAVKVIGRAGMIDHRIHLLVCLLDPAPEVRGAATQALANLGDSESINDVAFLLSDQKPGVRGSAATALGMLGATQEVPALVACLSDVAANVRGSAAKALGVLGAPDAVKPLCAALGDDVPKVRGTAAVALGMIGDAFALPILEQAINDADDDVRRGVVVALGELGDSSVLPTLSTAAKDSVPDVRWTVANALGKIGDPEAARILVPLLEDEVSHVRGAAATALGRLGAQHVLSSLIPHATDSVPIVRGSVATALGRIGGPHTLEPLVALAADEDDAVRSSALAALGRLKVADSASVATVEAGMQDPLPRVRSAAIRAMSRIDPKRDMKTFLNDSDGEVRRSALITMRDKESAGSEIFLSAVQDSEFETRVTAVAALAYRPSTETIEGLVKALEDNSPYVVASATTSLGRLADRTGVPALVDGLSSHRPLVRRAASEVLGKLSAVEALDGLYRLLLADDVTGRAVAAKALERIGSTSSVGPLIAALGDVDGYVRGAAAMALSRTGIGSAQARSALIAALKDPNEAVIGIAARSLGLLGGESAALALEECARNEYRSLRTRSAALLALGPLQRRPRSWMRVVADTYAGSPLGSDAAKFRGAIISVVGRGGWDDDVQAWLLNVLTTDQDPINQSVAALSLAEHGAMAIGYVRKFVTNAGTSSKKGGPAPRADTIGVVLQAGIKSAAENPNALGEMAQELGRALNRRPSPLIASAALSAVASLDTTVGQNFLVQLRSGLDNNAKEKLLHPLSTHQKLIEQRLRDELDYQKLAASRESFLQAFFDIKEQERKKKMTYDIGIVTIIGEEARAVTEWLLGYNPTARRKGGANRIVYEAKIPVADGVANVVAIQALNQGSMSAVLAHQYLIDNFQPSFIVLVGIAGGIHKQVRLGDVVIADQVINYGPAATTDSGVHHRGESFLPPPVVVAALNDFFTRGEPLSLTAHLDNSMPENRNFTLRRGPIGTGPRVVKFREAEERKFLESFNEKTLALETEAESIARNFYEHVGERRLTGYLIIRAISDHADEAKDDSWKLAASRNAVLVLQELLPVILEVATTD